MRIDGKKIRDQYIENIINDEINRELHIILVGCRKDSEQYVKNKIKFCEAAGIKTTLIRIEPEGKNEIDIKKEILNYIPQFGEFCIIQMPMVGLSKESESQMLDLIPEKSDIDALSSKIKKQFYSTKSIDEALKYAPLTAFGIIKLFNELNISLESKVVTVIGRSDVVGRPLTHMLGLLNATVCCCNSKTNIDSLKSIITFSDIVISATGVPGLINISNFKDVDFSKKIIIDVGINYINGKFVGDIDEEIKERAALYTPNPGGVGPLTIKSLIQKINDFK